MIVTIVGLMREEVGVTIEPLNSTGDLLSDIQPTRDELRIIILNWASELDVDIQTPHHGILDEIGSIVTTVEQSCIQSTREKVLFVKTTKAIADQAWITCLQLQTDGFPIVFILNGERKASVDQNEAMHEKTSWLWRRRSVDWARSMPYRFDRAVFAKCHLPNGRWHHEQLSDSSYPSPFSNVDRRDYLSEINLEFFYLCFVFTTHLAYLWKCTYDHQWWRLHWIEDWDTEETSFSMISQMEPFAWEGLGKSRSHWTMEKRRLSMVCLLENRADSSVADRIDRPFTV